MASLKNVYDRKCTLCPLHSNEGETCLSGGGNIKTPRLLIVGDGPSKNESQMRRSFSDQRGQLLQVALEEAQIGIGSDGVVFATYATKCFPSGKIKQKDAKTCSDTYLIKEIFHFKPELILVLGKTSQVAVLHNNSPISKTHGKLFEHTFELDGQEFTTQVMPIEHPFSVIQSPQKYDQWMSDLRRVRTVLYSEGSPFWDDTKLDRFDFRVIESVSEFKAVARDLIADYRGHYLSLDIEASGLDNAIAMPGYDVYTIQFGIVDLEDEQANYTNPVYILPIRSSQFLVSSDRYRDIWLPKIVPLVDKFLHPKYFKLTAHNGKYDLKGLRTVGITSPQLYWDTMMLWANEHGEAPMSLKEIAYQVTDLGGYEKDMEEYFKEHGTYDAPRELLVWYGGLDIVVTRHLMKYANDTVLRRDRR